MRKLHRRDLLKTLAIVTVAAIMGIVGKLGVTYAAPAGGTAIHIHGTVSNPDLGLAIAINH
jgi:hypothetical protein